MLSDFISLFFPNYCLSCNNGLVRGEELICIRCHHEMPRTESHLDEENFIANKFYGKIHLLHALAYLRFTKNGKAQKLLHKLKYQNKPELGVYFGRWYGELLYGYGFDKMYDIIVPVPLHNRKKRRRGYNQSLMFASGLSERLKVPVRDVLRREVHTSTQTRKSRLARWRNVENIFSVTQPDMIVEKKILLVDDVITTGATLEACALCLQNGGCKSVGVAAIAAAK